MRLRFLFDLRQERPTEDDGIVTAFRDGQVTLRANRREEGFTNAVQEVGYQRVEAGDLVIHAMDAFAGAIGVSDSTGKCSPVCQVLVPREGVNPHYVAYALRHAARTGYIQSLARGIRERSTDFRWSIGRNVVVPLPDWRAQRDTVHRLDVLRDRSAAFLSERRHARQLVTELFDSELTAALSRFADDAVPLKNVVGFREGPGIMAADFRDEGVPLLRLRNLVGDTIDLTGCGHLDPDMVASRWAHFRVEPGELLVSGSATSGAACVVPEHAVGAIPYTGLIRMWPADDRVDRDYLWAFLRSSLFADQIDRLKTGVAIQHWGPNHLRQVKLPLPPREQQRAIARAALDRRLHERRLSAAADREAELLHELLDAQVASSIAGQPPGEAMAA